MTYATHQEVEDALLAVIAAAEAHRVDTTDVHGIANTAALVVTTDPRLADARVPLPHTSTSVTDFTEAVQDAVAALLGAGTNVTLTYDDAANTLTVTSAAGGLDAEAVRDAIGIALVGVGNISVAVNDVADTITLSTTATVNSTDAALRDRSTHTGVQAVSTVTGLQAALDGKEASGAAASAVETHRADTTVVHGIADTAALVVTTDPRLSDQRVPVDGSVTPAKLSFDPATQAELNTEATTRGNADTALDGRLGTVEGALPGKAEASALATETTARTSADTALDGRLDTVEATLPAKADLVGGVIPTSQIPAVATGQTVTVASQAAMLALTGAQVQPGDVAIRSDLTGRRFLLANVDPSLIGSWIALETPDAVSSVNGQSGAVVLGSADVGADPAGTAATAVEAHRTDTTSVHGITDTAQLETLTGAQAKADTAQANAITAAGLDATAKANTVETNLTSALGTEQTARIAGDTALSGRVTRTEMVALPSTATDYVVTDVRPATASPVAYVRTEAPLTALPGDTWVFEPRDTPRPVIWSTDWWTDVDDAVALRLLAWAERQGLVDVRGFLINTKLAKGPGSLDALAIFEGMPGKPIGAHPTYVPAGVPSYQATLFNANPHTAGMWAATPSAITLARQLLAAADNASVDWIEVGYLTTMYDLLLSPADTISALTGAQLVAAKVRKTWIMGGYYPLGSENNFNKDATARTAANYVVANWPGPIDFLGFEVSADILVGGNLVGTGANDPLAQAMVDHGSSAGRSSWDPMLTLVACLGDPALLSLSTVSGTNSVNAATGKNIFTAGAGNHRYMVKTQPDHWYKFELNRLLARGEVGMPDPSLPIPAALKGLAVMSSSVKRSPKATLAMPIRTPSQTTNLLLNLNADDLTDLAAAAVVQHWDDRMLRYPARMLTSANAPTFNVVGAKNAVQFAAGKWMVTDLLAVPFPITIFVSAYWAALPAATQTIVAVDHSTGATNHGRLFHLGINATNQPLAVAFPPDPAVGAATDTELAVAALAWGVLAMKMDTTSVQVFFNGTSAGSTAFGGSTTAGMWRPISLGSRYYDATSEATTAAVHEVRVYSGALSNTAIADISTVMA
jgi:purine nucleosidase